MTMKRNDMQRMIIQGVRRFLCRVQPAQEAMGAGSTDHLTGVNRSLEPAQPIFPSETDCVSPANGQPFFREQTGVLSATNRRSVGDELPFSREGICVPSGGNLCSLGRKPLLPRLRTAWRSAFHALANALSLLPQCLSAASFSPHLALRSLLLIALILGGVLESGAATTGKGGKVTSIDDFSSVLGKKVKIDPNTNTVTLTDDINLNATLEIATDVVLDLGTHKISYSSYGVKDFLAVKVTSGTVTIKNGTIKGEHTRVGGRGIGLEVNTSDSLFLSSVVIQGIVGSGSVRAARGIQYTKGNLIIVSGTFSGSGGIDNAIYSESNNVIDFFKGSYIDGKDASNLNTKTIEGSITVKQTKYTIKYEFDDGTLDNDLYVKEYTALDVLNRTVQDLPSLSKDYYDFSNWSYLDETNTKTISNSSELLYPYVQSDTHQVTLKAKWNPKNYRIEFNSQGGSLLSPLDVTYETSTISLNDAAYKPTQNYYDFGGWYDNADCTGSPVTEIKQTTSKRTLYAKWTPKTYTITYISEDIIISEDTFQINSTKNLLSLSDKDGAKFVGWKDAVTDEKLTALPGDNPRNLTLEAIWSYTYKIKYSTGTSETITDNTSHKTTEEVTLPKPQVDKDGYTFSHWIDQKNEKEFRELKIPANTYTKEDKNVTLTAVWTPETYELTFHAEGFSGYPTIIEFTVESEEIKDFPQLDKRGYIFQGWSDGTRILTSIPKGTSANISLMAQWEQIKYNLVYEDKKGFVGQSDSYTVETYASISLPVVAERKDYDFEGWFMNGVKQDVVPFDWETKQTPITFTLQATWTVIPYTVKFDLNYPGGGMLPGDQYTYNAEKGMDNLPDKTVATRTGYTLKDWYDDPQGTGEPVSKIAAGTGEKKLYAQWTPNTYNITYNCNGGEILSDAPSKFVYNEGVTLPKKEEMHKDHYDFAGWTRDLTSTNYVAQIEANQYAEHQTFYAQWTPATYTIQFNANDGTAVAELSYRYESEAALKKSYRNGYTFGGWYFDSALTDPVGDKVTSSTIKDNSPRAITFYAKWNPIQYTITYDTYGGTIQSGQVDSYRTGEEVMLPMDVKRDGFSFAGWYADDLLTHLATKIEADDYGNKTFYATWSRGFSVILSQPKEGVISVKQGDQVIASGTPLSKGTELTISATPTTSGYVLKQLVINGQAFTTSPQKVTMGEANLIISAEFVASTKPTVSAPTITTDPDREKVDAETLVKVTLAKTDAASTLYYALNNQQASPYSAPFVVDGGVGDTVTIRAIARREGYNDGITTRRIVFDGRLHLTFDLPAGVTATAPDGGTVVDAIVKGGTFEFKLQVDKSYFASTDSLQVMANDSLITPGSSGVYRLYDQKGDVKVVVKGLKAYTCVVTLLQTEHGQIAFAEGEEESSRTIAYGTELTLQATADEDYKFSKWSTGSQQNPLKLTVVSDTTLSATFVHDYKAYQITLPEVEGVTAKPFTGYSTEVKRDGTFKFYLVIANGYHEEQLVVRADGEELVKNKGGYALYHITKNIRISVEGIARDAFALTLPPNVQAWKLATMEEAAKASLYAETTLLLQAMAPEGQRFLKWTDGSTENPRTATALDAKQLYPLFTTLSEIPTAKVSLEQTAGAGITGATSNLDVANLGDQLSVKVVVLPAYSQSEVRLLANGQSVEPQARLRAASEAKSYYYQVPVAQADVKLKVEGLRLNQYQLTVAESTGGRVEGVPSGKVTHGDTVSLTAKAAEGMTFVRWWDGNTLNPYPYPVTGDQTIRAYFVGESSPVDNESVTAEEVRVCSPTTGGLWVELPVPQDIWLWDSSGRLLLHRFESGTVRLTVPAGIYLLQCGMRPAFKVVVRQ